MLRSLVSVCALVGLFAFGCGAADKPPTDFAVMPKLAEAIAKANKVVLFEGLPHQLFEGDLLKKELTDKKTVTIAGYPSTPKRWN